MQLFKCRKCPHEGPIEEFAKDQRRKTPYECKQCKGKRSRKHYDENKTVYASRGPRRRFEAREVVNKIKTENPCMDCGQKFHYCQMDFDHRDQDEKKKQVSYMLLHGIETILNEVKKCDLVCANCHRDRTQRQIEQLPKIEPGNYESQRLRDINLFVNSLKNNKICADCQLPHPYWRLDFDHRDHSQKFMTVSRMKLSKYSNRRILQEVAKCDLVCARCHRLRTFKRNRELRAGET